MAILIFDRSREKGGSRHACKDVFFVDSSKDFVHGKNQNTLSDDFLDKIVASVKKRKAVDKYAYVAPITEIAENDYNLNIPRYVDTFVEEEPIDVDAVQAEIEALEAKLVVVRAEMAKKLAEIQR